MSFDHKQIETKWQKYWEENNTFETNMDSDKEKYYVLDMFPYPSGSGLHVGHPEGYTATDIMARYKRFIGKEVLHPMGWDAFGLPAEQYAILTGNSPKEFTYQNIDVFKGQLRSLGFSYDWKREVNTSEPRYYKWTQWIFAQLYKKGLAVLKPVEVNWCPELNTVLANEETWEGEDGKLYSERGDHEVIKKEMNQWVLRITEYADKLFNGLDKLDWPEGLKNLQRNWIYEEDENGTRKLHLQDWLFSRQRYWGEPFPITHKEGEIYLIPEEQYPVILPEIDDYKFSQDGKPALSKAKDWIERDGGEMDLNTMPQWAGSCWYFMAYITKDGEEYLPLDSEKAKKRLNDWMPVDLYIGGQEHAVLHLIYARFWTIFLSEIGVLEHPEPFQKLFNQGMILGEDGQKMSKSKGNVVNPDDVVNEYGADALRLYLMFMGPLDQDKPWTTKGISAARSWIDRVYRFFTEIKEDGEPSDNVKRAYNKLLDKVTGYIEEIKYNVAISEMMVFINTVMKDKTINKEIGIGFITMLSTITPHIAEEIYSSVYQGEGSISKLDWPKKLDVSEAELTTKIVIQVNGKVRAQVENPSLSDEPTEDELKELVISNTNIKLEEIKKVIYIKNKLISVVV